MVVRDEGRDLLVMHHPNQVPLERAMLVPVAIGYSQVVALPVDAEDRPADMSP